MAEPISQFDSEEKLSSTERPARHGPVSKDLNESAILSDQQRRQTSAARLVPGDVIAERYKIVSVLGAGGMGIVYKAIALETSNYVAVKTLRSPHMTVQALERFRKEAKAASALHHNGLIKVHEFGKTDHGLPFMVMDFIEGGSLADAIKENGQLPLDRVVNIFLQSSEALAYAHEQGIIHRDLKPSNILLLQSPDGQEQVCVADFGVAMILEDDSGGALRLTHTGELLGSPLYMSPEQCAGKRADQRSDIYALACAMYEALTGAPPFQGETALATILKHQQEESPTLTEGSFGRAFPEILEDMIAKALAKDPSERYQSMREFRQDLLDMKAVSRIKKSQPEAKVEATVKRQKRLLTVPLPVVAVLAVAGMVLSSAVTVMIVNLNSNHDVDKVDREVAQPVNVIWEDQEAPKEGEKTEVRNNLRTFHFPDKYTAGGLYNVTPTTEFVSLGQATGTRSFPVNLRLQLRPSWTLCETPILFLRFRPDDFYELNCENLPLTDRPLRYIEHLTGLHRLCLSSTKITDDGMESISKLSQLDTLNLSSTAVTGKGILALSKLTTIKQLVVNGVPVDDWELQYFQQGPPLTAVDMRGCNLKDEQLASFANLKSVISLQLESNPGITDEGLKYLQRVPRLCSLDVVNCNITPGGISALKAMKFLGSLQISTRKWSPDDVRKLRAELPRCRVWEK
jgi:serine/threonine protein kinase